MRESFPGFYRPTKDEFAELWASALIVPDTNILLTLYRLSETTRGKLLQILEELKERLFIPYQVGFEFQKNRIDVIDEQKKAYAKVEQRVQGFAREVGGGMGRHPRLDKSDLEKRISEALKPVEDHLAGISANHPDPLADKDALGADAVRDKLDEILAGRLGDPHDVDELTKNGRKRYERKQPPGYEDRKKDEPERYGDLAIWLDMIERSRKEKKGIIFVTEERKEDWWWKHGKDTFAPRYELVEEMRRETEGQRFYIYGLERFMKYAAEALNIDLSQDERDDVARAGDVAAAESSASAETWYSKVSPIVSGKVFPQHAGTFFPASPASGFTEYPIDRRPFKTGFSQYPSWMQQWSSSVEERGAEALLSVAWEPYIDLYGVHGDFHCLVTSPAGNMFGASANSDDLRATLRFPANFPTDEGLEQGLYTYEWFYMGPGDPTLQKVASGNFELEVPEMPDSEGQD